MGNIMKGMGNIMKEIGAKLNKLKEKIPTKVHNKAYI